MLNKNMNTYHDEINNIISLLYQKSKRSFRNCKKDLKNQVFTFSPFYRDFIYKVIKNNSLKIENKWNDGYIIPNGEIINTSNLKKRQNNKIYTDIRNANTLPHELGHAIDFWFGENQSLSINVILSNNKTLSEVFFEEFELKHKEIYEEVMNEYKLIINSNINDKAYDLLINNMNLYNKLNSLPVNVKDKELTKQRRKLQNHLYEIGFVEAYYQLFNKKCFNSLNLKYSPILDALSSKYDFNGLFLNHHRISYYNDYKNNAVYEFFANLFEAKVTSKHIQFDNLIKFLPKSFEAFEELFFIFYNHIQNNKRFTDVKLRKGTNND